MPPPKYKIPSNINMVFIKKIGTCGGLGIKYNQYYKLEKLKQQLLHKTQLRNEIFG